MILIYIAAGQGKNSTSPVTGREYNPLYTQSGFLPRTLGSRDKKPLQDSAIQCVLWCCRLYCIYTRIRILEIIQAEMTTTTTTATRKTLCLTLGNNRFCAANLFAVNWLNNHLKIFVEGFIYRFSLLLSLRCRRNMAPFTKHLHVPVEHSSNRDHYALECQILRQDPLLSMDVSQGDQDLQAVGWTSASQDTTFHNVVRSHSEVIREQSVW